MTGTQDVIHEYSAETSERGMLRSALSIVGYPSLMLRYRGLIGNFFSRELFGRFRGSFLGVFWVLIHPLFLFGIYYAVFGYLFEGAKLPDGKPDPTFAVYLFAGIIVWTAFSEASTRACQTVVENGNLVKKVAFPSQLLPVHLVLVSLVVELVGALVLFAVGIPFGVVRPDLHLLLLPLVILVQFFFTLGFGLLLANLHVFMRDTSHLYGVVSMAWFFASPIFWLPSMVSDKLGSLGLDPGIMVCNPMYPLMGASRIALGLGYPTARGYMVPEPFWYDLGLSALWAVGFMVVGYGSFMAQRHKFADLV